MAQEVQAVMPEAVARGQDGYLRAFYDKLGLKFETHDVHGQLRRHRFPEGPWKTLGEIRRAHDVVQSRSDLEKGGSHSAGAMTIN